MPNITTSALESIDALQLLSVSGGCCPPKEPPPTPLPTAQTMGPPQQTAGGDSVVNTITITNASGTTTRTA